MDIRIFIINLERSADRREAMRERIGRLSGECEVYLNGDLVETSPLGSHSADFENFNHKIDTKSYLGLKFSKNSQSTTANARSLDSKTETKNENLANENLKSSLRESKANEAIQSIDCHDLPCKSRNDRKIESSDLQNRNKNNLHEVQQPLKASSEERVRVVREGEENDFAFVRSTNPHLQIQVPLSPFDKNNRNEVAAQFKKSENEAERKIDSSGLPRSLAASHNDKEIILAESRNDKNIESTKLENVKDSTKDSIINENLRFTQNLSDSTSKSPKETKKLTLYFEFFSALDANLLKNGEAKLENYNPKVMRFIRGKELSYGEMGCFGSHLGLWEKCVKLDSPIVVIEDDVEFESGFVKGIDEIYKSNFEYVRLINTIERKMYHIKAGFHFTLGKICGTQGYYLTPSAARKFIKRSNPALHCVDDYMDMFYINDVLNVVYKPFLIRDDDANSTIQGIQKDKVKINKLTREISRLVLGGIKILYLVVNFYKFLSLKRKV